MSGRSLSRHLAAQFGLLGHSGQATEWQGLAESGMAAFTCPIDNKQTFAGASRRQAATPIGPSPSRRWLPRAHFALCGQLIASAAVYYTPTSTGSVCQHLNSLLSRSTLSKKDFRLANPSGLSPRDHDQLVCRQERRNIRSTREDWRTDGSARLQLHSRLLAQHILDMIPHERGVGDRAGKPVWPV